MLATISTSGKAGNNMAEKRMFAKTIIDSDEFLDMPTSAQALYFHLCMRADDDGFVNNPKKIQRIVNCSDDDLKLLLMKQFILAFESGVIVVRHWKLHNYIRKDRLKPTIYQDEMAQISEDESGRYVKCQADVSHLTDKCQHRLDKIRLDKTSIGGVGDEQSPSPLPEKQKDKPFDVFWKEYPKKVGKEAARKAFAKAKSKASLEEMLKALQEQKTSVQWQRDNGQYIPNPSTWLNQGRWADELDITLTTEEPQQPKKRVEYREVEIDGEIVLERVEDGQP